jgi:hypothetical protein
MRSLILRKNGRLLNDTFVHAQTVSSPPEVYERDLYGNLIPVFDNLIMYDPDAPNPMHPSPFPFLHWLNINNGHQVPYMGPAPPASSPPHRYVIAKLEGIQSFYQYEALHRYELNRAHFS